MSTITFIAKGSGVGTTDMTLTSIPQTYDDLLVIANLQSSSTPSNRYNYSIRFNNVATSSYERVQVWGVGSMMSLTNPGGGTSSEMSFTEAISSRQDGPTSSATYIWIHNYASTSVQKTLFQMSGTSANNQGGATVSTASGRFHSTSAITSMQFLVGSGNWGSETEIWLYGIKNS